MAKKSIWIRTGVFCPVDSYEISPYNTCALTIQEMMEQQNPNRTPWKDIIDQYRKLRRITRTAQAALHVHPLHIIDIAIGTTAAPIIAPIPM